MRLFQNNVVGGEDMRHTSQSEGELPREPLTPVVPRERQVIKVELLPSRKLETDGAEPHGHTFLCVSDTLNIRQNHKIWINLGRSKQTLTPWLHLKQ